MGGIGIYYGEGQTLIDEDEKGDLIPFWAETNGELNRLEQANINKAILFFEGKKMLDEDILTIPFVKELHRRMFDDVWKWAGAFRRTDKNIGVDKRMIVVALHSLLQDVLYWIAHETYERDAIAIRCKHRLVSIHPFSNGNGRHSRIFADLLARSLGQKAFRWGAGVEGARAKYLSALREADKGNYDTLIDFARC